MKPATAISYCVLDCTLGSLLVAGTQRGICFVRFGGGALELEQRLKGAFPFAPIARAESGDVARWGDALAAYIDGRSNSAEVPLDVSGSRFEERVWGALRQIPRGETRSYSEIARAVGNPRGARAVARACAENPVAVLIPCHRVIEKAGTLGGYGGGVSRKRALLEREGASFRD
jgi:AraC family transcriptional regulator, regulatory protein of adaptative response / methylated-DNA-[protein]-cysteine methyltransferase